MRLLFYINIVIIFCVTKVFAQNNEFSSGLYFASSEVVQDKRTSLNLTPEGSLKLINGLTLDFDIRLREGDGYYGYVFRIFSNETDNFDFITNYASPDDNFSLVFKDKILCTFRWQDIPGVDYNRWFHVTFQLDQEKQTVQISINDVLKSAHVEYEKDNDHYEILFGVSKSAPFQSTDVCPMTLKNIRIFDFNKKLVRHWLLSKHVQNKTYDEVDGALALVDNPKWLIDAHLFWEEVIKFDLDAFYGVTSDENADKLYFIDRNSVISYNFLSNDIDTIPYLGGSPYRQSNEKHAVYNPFTNEIWSYNLDRAGVSKLDFFTQKWSAQPVTEDESNFGHHNKFISPADSSLVALFGYGFYRYNSTIFNYKPASDTWTSVDRSDQIGPRYLAATGLLNNNTLLVFGGYGSKTGRQELTPGTYNDLYSLDLTTFQFKKLQEYQSLDPSVVPAESLILDNDSTGFYALVFDNSKYESRMKLVRLGIYEPTQVVYPDSIKFNFLDTDSWSYLYLNKSLHKLFAVTTNKSAISIYSIAYPPLVQEDVFQNVKQQNRLENRSQYIIFLIAALLLSVLAFMLFRKRQKDDNELKSVPALVVNEQIFRNVKREKKSSVLFLGGFQIYNESGVDITSDFSPILKQLFLIIFFNTVHRGKGISSAKLDEALWFDKSDKSARNNRNVNVSKLRSAIEEVGGLEIINENSYWKLRMSSNIYCDYLHVLNIINKSGNKDSNIENIAELSELLSNGELLPNLQVDWIDSYKAQYTNSVIDFLVKMFSKEEIKKEKKTLIQIADSIFSLDSLNEDALIVKCQVLHKEGKSSVALHVYNSFCKEYHALLNTEYPSSLKDILEGNTEL